jgi:hypothetical protein
LKPLPKDSLTSKGTWESDAPLAESVAAVESPAKSAQDESRKRHERFAATAENNRRASLASVPECNMVSTEERTPFHQELPERRGSWPLSQERPSLKHSIMCLQPELAELSSGMRLVRLADEKREFMQPLPYPSKNLLQGFIKQNWGLELSDGELQSVADLLKTNKHIPSTSSPAFKQIIDIVLKQTILVKDDQLNQPSQPGSQHQLVIEPERPGSSVLMVHSRAGTYRVHTGSVFRPTECHINVKDMPTASAPKANCRLFLSYRVNADKHLAETLHDKLRAEHVDVWWDGRCLPDGQSWEEGFVDGLCTSDIFVPIMSKAALAPCANLMTSSRCDNVILEYQVALDLKSRKQLRAIFPVLVGEASPMYRNFFEVGGAPRCIDEVVHSIDNKLCHHLQRLGKGKPYLSKRDRTVHKTLGQILECQGIMFTGEYNTMMQNLVNRLVKLSQNA